MAYKSVLVLLTEAEQEAVFSLSKNEGFFNASVKIGIQRGTLMRVLARVPVQERTANKVREWIKFDSVSNP